MDIFDSPLIYGAPFAGLHGVSYGVGNQHAISSLRALRYMRPEMYMHSPSMGRMGSTAPQANPFLNSSDSGISAGVFQDPVFRANADQALSQYGLQLPEARQNAFLPEGGFFGNHPRLSAGLEGAMLGAAGTQGAETVGQGVSNAINGGLGSILSRNAMLSAPYEQTFRAAQQMEQMRDLGDKHDLNQAELAMRGAQTNEFNAQAKRNAMLADSENMKNQFPSPVVTSTGTYKFNRASAKAGKDPWDFVTDEGLKAVGQGGGGIFGEVIRGKLGMPPTPGTKASQQYWTKAEKIYEGLQAGTAYGRARASNRAGLDDDTKQTITDKQKAERQKNISNKLMTAKPSFWATTAGIDPMAPAAQKQQWLEDNYDTWAGAEAGAKPKTYNPATGKLE